MASPLSTIQAESAFGCACRLVSPPSAAQTCTPMPRFPAFASRSEVFPFFSSWGRTFATSKGATSLLVSVAAIKSSHVRWNVAVRAIIPPDQTRQKRGGYGQRWLQGHGQRYSCHGARRPMGEVHGACL